MLYKTLAVALAGGALLIGAHISQGAVTVTPASGGTNLSADTAANASTPAWAGLGAITIAEPSNGSGTNDFAAGADVTLVLKAPAGYEFNTNQTPDVSFTPLRDISNASAELNDASTLTITLTVLTTLAADTLTIGGTTNLQVRPLSGNPLAAALNVHRPSTGGGTAVITGIVADADGSGGTSFGALSEIPGAATRLAFTTQPTNAVVGALFGTQPVVQTQDQFSNASTSGLPANLTVSMALSAGTGTLLGTTNLDIGASAGMGTATYTNLQLDIAGTGRELTASATGLTNAVSSLFDVAKASQVITFDSIPTKFYGDGPFQINATASSGLPVSFVVAFGPVSITNTNTIIIHATGTATIRANQAGDSNYNAAPFVDRAIHIEAVPLIITPHNQERVPGQTTPVLTGTITGIQYNDDITATYSTTADTNSPPGNYPISAAISDPGNKLSNYNVTTNTGFLSIHVPLTEWRAATNGNGHWYEVILTPNGIDWNDAEVIATNKGGYLATITSAEENEFVFSLFSGNTNFWKPSPPTALVPNFVGPWLGGHREEGSIEPVEGWMWVTGEPFTYHNWGTNRPNNIANDNRIQYWYGFDDGVTPAVLAPTWNDLDNTNITLVPAYVIEYNGNTNKLDQAITFNAPTNKTYGDAPFSISATASSGLPVSFSIFSGPATISSNLVSITGAGTIVVRASQAGDDTYNPAPPVNQPIVVNPVPLTGTADDKSRIYGNTNPVFTATYTGFLFDDTTNLITGTLIGSTPATTNSPVGTYPISVSGQTASNYTITYVDGTLTVTQASLTVTANNTNRTVGATNPVFTGVLTGVKNNDNITATYSTTADTNSAPGFYSIVPALVDPGNKLTNYSVTISNGLLSVNPDLVPWPTNAGGNGHFYQAMLAPGGIAWSNAQAIAVSRGGYLATITSASENAFAYSLVSGNPVFWRDVGNGNGYGPWLGGVQTNGSPEPDGGWGWITGEPFTYINWGAFQPNDTGGTEDRIQFFGFNATEGSAWNDLHENNLDFVRSFLIEFDTDPTTKTNQTITFDPLPDVAYGASPISLIATASSGLPVAFSLLAGPATLTNDTLTITGAGNVTVRATQSGNIDYHPALPVDRSFTVNAVPLTVTADDASRAVGEPNPVFTGDIVGIVNNDNITATYSTTADTGSPAGDYPIIPSLVDPGGKLTNYNVTSVNGTLTVTNSTVVQPVILSLTGAGTTNLVITWSAESNRTYRVRYREVMDSGSWTNIVPDITATNDTASASDNPDGATQRFYQVLQLP